MIDLLDKDVRPTLEELGGYVRDPAFLSMCQTIKDAYRCEEKIEYSACSMEKGWNVKFKKAGRALCTIYPKEGRFTVLVAVGRKEKAAVEALLPECAVELRELYHQTREWNGQRWLMIDLEDQGPLYGQVLRLIQIRRTGRA